MNSNSPVAIDLPTPSVQLHIYTEEEQAQFSIFQTEIGRIESEDYHLGKALTDEKLFTICRDHGDSKGSLKFFIRHVTPETETCPCPLPQFPHQASTHLRPKRRSGSISSNASEQLNESATGYEADIDNEKESHRTTLRPQHPMNVPNPPLSSPQYRRPNNSVVSSLPSQLPSHPLHPLSSLAQSPSLATHSTSTFTNKFGQVLPTPPPPPPLSRPKFPINDDSTFLPPPLPSTHENGRSGSDAAAEAEEAIITPEHQVEETARRKVAAQQPLPSSSRSDIRSRDALNQVEHNRQRKRIPIEGDDWYHVSLPGREYDPSSTTSSKDPGTNSRKSPPNNRKPINQTSPRSRAASPYQPLIPPSPRTQPPPVPSSHSTETRSTQRTAGNPVPGNFLVRWKGESKVAHQPPNSTKLSRVSTKSMDSLRNHLSARTGQPNPLSVNRGPRDHLALLPSYLSGTPKSYESFPRLPINSTRPPASQYNVPESNTSLQMLYPRKNMSHSKSNANFGTNMSPYHRPPSATGDHVVSPVKYSGRQVHSPTYGSTLLPEAYDSVKSPRATSPSRLFHHPPGPRPRSSRNVDSSNSGFETSHSTPPHSPATPRSPRPSSDERNFKVVDDTSPSSHVPGRSSHDTLKQEDWSIYLQGREIGEEGTIVMPHILATPLDNRSTSISITTTAASQPPSRTASPSLVLNSYHNESSDDGGNGTWIVKPQPQLSPEEKPKLKVQIETPTTARLSPPSTGSTATLTVPSAAGLNSKGNSALGSIDGVGSSKHVGILTEMMMHEKEREGVREQEKEKERKRGETEKALEKEHDRPPQKMFADDEDGWAMRPPPEAVYEKLELYFRNHDLDKPVIEANSGGTSPTSIEPAISPQAVAASTSNRDKDKEREHFSKIRSKKSIRYVAEDAKRRIDRTSKADSSFADIALRKRNTKFWGGKLEEVTTHQVKSSSASSTTSTSPSGSKLQHFSKLNDLLTHLQPHLNGSVVS